MQYDIKAEIEQYFIDNWINTPIQFQGVDFDQPNAWISLIFIPIERTANTCGRVMSNAQLKILCYDTNPSMAIKLMDEVNTFFDCKTLTKSYSGAGNADGLGIIDLLNNTYEVATLYEINSLV